MRDIRGRTKREKEWLAANPLQACEVCGRYFTAQRKDAVCSMACKAKLDSGQDGQQTQ
jgi:hypothetical protein